MTTFSLYTLLYAFMSAHKYDRGFDTNEDLNVSMFDCSLGYATTGAEDQPPRPPTGVPASGDYILPHTQLELGHSMVSAGASISALLSIDCYRMVEIYSFCRFGSLWS